MKVIAMNYCGRLLLLLGFLRRSTNAMISSSVSTWRPINPAELSMSIVHRMPNKYRFKLQGGKEEHDVIHPRPLLGHEINKDQCTLYKVVINKQLHFEHIHYEFNMPDLKEFTLCMWTTFSNHTNDHPLFSYTVEDQPRSILAWVANTQRSSYFMMNIDGHNLYRLNYPLRLNTWYHSCQSWNGRTGEWQIWINDERVGRGFNNRLVDHVIKGGGTAITGQKQQQLHGGYLKHDGAPSGVGGMLGEVTMVQLYGVALTAGKAHRDHKHHHAHHFEHDTSNNVLPLIMTQATVTRLPLPMSPFLTGGQLNHQVKINPGAHVQIIQNGVTLRHPALPVPTELRQPLPPTAIPAATVAPFLAQSLPQPAGSSFDFNRKFSDMSSGTSKLRFLPLSYGGPPVNGFSFVDRRYRNVQARDIQTIKSSQIERQQNAKDTADMRQQITESIDIKQITKRESKSSDVKQMKVAELQMRKLKRRSSEGTSSDKKKRGLLFTDGSVVEEAHVQQIPQLFMDDYLQGLTSFGLETPNLSDMTTVEQDEREPAEDEVRRVMNICDGCAEEPFGKALVMSWRNVHKKLYSEALYVPATQVCKDF